LLIALGILAAAFGLKGFLLSSNFIDGGVTGVSLLLAKVTRWPLSVWLAMVGLSAALATIHFPDGTPDLLLTAVFGGFFIGAGIGLTVRGGAVLDGTEIAALLISKRSALLKVGDVILAFNIVLFLVAMTLLGVEPALYSILTYLAAARTLDFVIYGLEQYTAITIVSARSAPIRERIVGELERGVTVYQGRGGLTGAEQEILYCVV